MVEDVLWRHEGVCSSQTSCTSNEWLIKKKVRCSMAE